MKKSMATVFLIVVFCQSILFASVDHDTAITEKKEGAKEIFDPLAHGGVELLEHSSSYREEDILIFVCRTYKHGLVFVIELQAKALASNKIIKPERFSVYKGVEIFDNFGNDLGFETKTGGPGSIQDLIVGEGLRPMAEKSFAIKFRVEPLENTKYILLKIPKHTFGNVKPFEIKMPNVDFGKLSVCDESFHIHQQTDDIDNRIVIGSIVYVLLCVCCFLGLMFLLSHMINKKSVPSNRLFLLLFTKHIKRLAGYVVKKQVILWLGISLFGVWCLVSLIADLHLRQFIPIALAIITITGGFIYTFRDKKVKDE